MDETLGEALGPVFADVEAAGIDLPRVEADGWTEDPDRPSAMLWGRSGSGRGIAASRSDPLADRIATAADQVQEFVIEELWSHASTNWPPCPRHPTTHPLEAAVRDDLAVWTCPATGAIVAPIGSLQRS